MYSTSSIFRMLFTDDKPSFSDILKRLHKSGNKVSGKLMSFVFRQQKGMVIIMKLFDLHCDTAFELEDRNITLSDETLDINDRIISDFDTFFAVSAICADEHDTDETAYERFFKIKDNFKSECSSRGYLVCKNISDIKACREHNTPGFITAVEDARILAGKSERIQILFESGVRIITPMWGGESCIGGSHESERGLTNFGKEAAREFARLGIITDISHASERSAYELTDIAVSYGMPVIASHSCAFALNPHSRNIRDRQIEAVKASGGIIGVNTYPIHLTGTEHAEIGDVAEHIAHITDAVGAESMALGCDFDGMGACHTSGLEKISCIGTLYNALIRRGFSSEMCDKIFFENAYNFMSAHIAD